MKPNIDSNPHKVIKERSERLRRLRNLANLSRKELCECADININTYIGYEVGRYGGLTEKGAEKVVKYIAQKGVFATLEWLMNGQGPRPQVVTDTEIIDIFNLDENQEMKNISEEIFLFHKHYPSSIDYRVEDDGMAPKYDAGDFVAGVLYTDGLIDNLIGLDCIVKTNEGLILVRNVAVGRKEHHYNLVCSNPQTKVIQPVLYDVKIISAAYIIWHRRTIKNTGR